MSSAQSMADAWERITEVVRAGCASAGLDLVQPFRVDWYNEAVDQAYRLPAFSRVSALGLLVGNTRALWPRFLDALRAEPARLAEAHPLDAYAADALAAALRPLDLRVEVRGAHELPPRLVAMQRLAHVSGLAHFSPSHLNVHPVYGPWIAFRGAVVVDVDGPSGPRPDPPSPCADCAERCMAAFDRAVAATDDPVEAHQDITRRWPMWLAVRDACPIGRSHRYTEEQIRYHYTKDREIVARLLRREATT